MTSKLRLLLSPSFARNLKQVRSQTAKDVKAFHDRVGIVHEHRAEFLGKANPRKSQPIPSDAAIYLRRPLCTAILQRNSFFLGRDSQLGELRVCLSSEKQSTSPISCALEGIGGIGKTQVALEFTYRYRERYDEVFWISAESDSELRGTFGAIGRRLKLFDTEIIDQPKVEKVQEWLEATGTYVKSLLSKVLTILDLRWLLVFDNVHDWNTISRYWPRSSKAASSILITSQTPSGRRCNHRLRLTGMDSYNGSQLMLSQLEDFTVSKMGPDRKKLAEEISEKLGGSPLLIVQASCIIKTCGSSLEEYLARPVLGDRMMGANEYYHEGVLSNILNHTLGKLTNGAARLLTILAFFDYRDIREDLLVRNRHKDELRFLPAGHNRCVTDFGGSKVEVLTALDIMIF